MIRAEYSDTDPVILSGDYVWETNGIVLQKTLS